MPIKTTKPAKIDLFKSCQPDYATPRKPVLFKMQPALYLTIEGQGKPGGPEFEVCIGALYGAAFTIKMTRKFAGKGDYAVCKLEAQWWAAGTNDLSQAPMEAWRWKLMIRTPDFVSQEDLDSAVAVLLKRAKGQEVKRVKLENIDEGTCVQMLHIGPYDREGDTVNVMRQFAESKNLTFAGRHHEIYLSDPRRVPPERLKTILREPVQPA